MVFGYGWNCNSWLFLCRAVMLSCHVISWWWLFWTWSWGQITKIQKKKRDGWHAVCISILLSVLVRKKNMLARERQRSRLNHHEKLRLLEFHRVFFSSGMSTSLHPDNNFQDPGQLRRHQFPYLGWEDCFLHAK